MRAGSRAANIHLMKLLLADQEAIRALTLLPPAAELLIARLGPEFTPSVLLVGGAVRDRLLGATPADLDLLVEGPVEAVLDRLGGQQRRHGRFATATVTAEGFTFDLAAARRERYHRPGALPEVEPATVEEDLARRDFTVNALAYGLTGPRQGQLLGWPGALEDLTRGRLRALHEASFLDDPTRLLRLARYQARFDFEIEPRTWALAEKAIGDGALGTVTGARIGHELRLLAAERDPLPGWRALRDLAIDTSIAPGFGIDDRARAARALAAVAADGRAEIVVLASALQAVPVSHRLGLLERLAYPARDRDAALLAAADPSGLARALGGVNRPSELLTVAGERNPEAIALAIGCGVPARVQVWLERLRAATLEIGARDLLAAGAKPGPGLRIALNAALAATLDAGSLSRERQLEIALEAVARAG